MITLENGAALDVLIVGYVRPAVAANVITGRTMGGAWFVQTVGTAAKRAEVQAVITGIDSLTALLNAYAEGRQITVEADGLSRGGYIDKEPKYDVFARGKPERRQFRVTFTLNVLSEVPL